MLEIFKNKISSYELPQNEIVALAVSGGADSTCMTLLFSQIQDFNVRVLVVDHKLRDESTREAEYVRDFISSKFNFVVEILTWERDFDVKSNVQSKARDARYKLITDYCKKHNIKYFCTAHNKGDRAETVLMNIMRGTGIDGLCSMRERASVDGIFLVRPMLYFTRDEIESHLKQYDVTWVKDPSNNNERYERIKIRKLLKTIEHSNLINAKHFISRLNLLSDNAQMANDFITKYVNKKIQQICKFFELGVIIINAEELACEESEVVINVLKESIKKCNNNKFGSIRGDSLMSLYNLFVMSYQKMSFFETTLGGCMILFCTDDKHQPILLVIKEKSFRNENFIKKNEVAKLTQMIIKQDCQIIDEGLFSQAMEIIKTIPKNNKIFFGTEFILKNDERIYPSLGISEILS